MCMEEKERRRFYASEPDGQDGRKVGKSEQLSDWPSTWGLVSKHWPQGLSPSSVEKGGLQTKALGTKRLVKKTESTQGCLGVR